MNLINIKDVFVACIQHIFRYGFGEGGPIGLVQNGDLISIDVQKRAINVELTDAELNERRKKWSPPPYKANRGVLHKVVLHNLASEPFIAYVINGNLSCSYIISCREPLLFTHHFLCHFFLDLVMVTEVVSSTRSTVLIEDADDSSSDSESNELSISAMSFLYSFLVLA
ncbi:hypothetical protein Gotur_023974 [Gossypium turneri]